MVNKDELLIRAWALLRSRCSDEESKAKLQLEVEYWLKDFETLPRIPFPASAVDDFLERYQVGGP